MYRKDLSTPLIYFSFVSDGGGSAAFLSLSEVKLLCVWSVHGWVSAGELHMLLAYNWTSLLDSGGGGPMFELAAGR
ncbi:hypothetical protein SK128_027382 [Halocaridina rubra]|uniref:Uncharacterized protein n=1 Tax=Halocaridina rubra TaxID=373956 RepID=A0AAN9ACU9_HALRR